MDTSATRRFFPAIGEGILFLAIVLSACISCSRNGSKAGTYPYRDKSLPVEERVEDLLGRMSLEEKVSQVSAQLLFMEEFYAKRDYGSGHVRNVGHFLPDGGFPNTPDEVARKINEDTRKSIESNRWGIPVLQHGEALHGAQWGSATCFPQSIGMAATFNDSLYHEVGKAVAEELRAVGVRQVYAPVINITRDQRWGRGQESYGEDVLLNSRFGVAYVKALQEGGVVATPKHFVDNYGEGGHDSFASKMSWRELREVYLEPFRACIQEGGAMSVMSAYNSVDGIPASSNPVLLQDILKKEWGFKGYVVSDYGAVEIIKSGHHMAESEEDALAQSMNNGLDLQLANTSPALLEMVRSGKIDKDALEESVRRVLRVKFGLGLFDEPLVDESSAPSKVRTPEHKALAYRSACEAITLLKNDGTLPLGGSVRRIGLFGPAANTVNLGDYSGPRGGWKGDDALSPYEALRDALKGKAEVVLSTSGQDIQPLASRCDVLVFFPSIMEDEGQDRSSFALPSGKVPAMVEKTGALIVEGGKTPLIEIDQEKMIRDLIATGKKVVVVLHNGAVVDISPWVDRCAAVLEAWYPGEQGARAIADVLTGKYNPGGRLPMSWARNIGQNPVFYSIKPSGRGYGYVENDGSPLYPFGYGLSYTTFEYGDFKLEKTSLGKDEPLRVSVKVTNTGKMRGDEVVQVYLHDEVASVARPLKELAAFRRISLGPGCSKVVELEIPHRAFAMWDKDMKFRVEEGWFEVWLGKDASQRIAEGRVYVK